MAKRLLNPLEDPPTASSSDDDEVETSSDEGEEQIFGSSSEENKRKDPSTKTLKTPSTATKKSSDSDSGSEADSDSESEPSPKATTAVSAVKSKKKESNDSQVVKSGMKRASEGTSTDVNAKKAKKVSASGEENKKAYFQRLWSEEDEISLLQGMIDYKADTGKSPYGDMNGFFEFVKKAISFEVSKVQFGDKIRGLKKKYLGKPKKGKEVTFAKAHDKKCFKLAKYIWGSDGLGLESAVKSPVQSKKKVDSMVESAVKSPKKIEKKKMDSMVEEDKEMLRSDGIVLESAKSLEPEGEKVEKHEEVLIHGGGSESPSWFEKSFLVGSITSFGVDEDSVKQRWSKVPVKTKKRIEEKLKLVQAKEFELLMLKTDILSDATSVISEAV